MRTCIRFQQQPEPAPLTSARAWLRPRLRLHRLHRLPRPLGGAHPPPPVGALPACSPDACPGCRLLSSTTALFRVYTVRLKCFGIFIFCSSFMYYLCEKHYKPITVQYYIANCVRWAPRLHLLDL